MRIPRIHYDGTLTNGSDVYLPPETSHYITHVLRLKKGMGLILFNGNGREYTASITHIKKTVVTAKVEDECCKMTESPLTLHLAQAISRSEKMNWAIQKAVELGVNTITPLITDYCSVKLPPEGMSKRMGHWKKIIISACEQSGRTVIPLLHPIYSFTHWIKEELPGLKLYCDPGAVQNLALPASLLNQAVFLLIGPEGGFSPQELKSAQAHHFLGISLGPRILRTETATLAAITLIQSRWGDLCATI
jgi:16S rRNA (uracil1498-N3)-methyltransferase